MTSGTKTIMYGCKLKDAAAFQNSNLSRPFCLRLSCHPHVFCGDSNTLVSVCFTAASLCVQQLPPSRRTGRTRRKVMNGCSQRRGNGISDQKNETHPKCIDLLGQIARRTDSLTDGWLLAGRLSNFPLTLSLSHSSSVATTPALLVHPPMVVLLAQMLSGCCLLSDIFKYLLLRLKSTQLPI